MNRFNIPSEKKVRVILDTDAKNEVDDQFAIVQAVLSESFDLRGVIAAHFGMSKSEHSVKNKFFTREFVPAAQSSQVERKAWLLVCRIVMMK